MVGEVDDIRDAMRQYAVFVAPILSGSGVRVKLLEAFAAGIPVVWRRSVRKG
ncbi:MAG: glycosyltransferase family 4 protein [Bryobacterales bacterium]